MTAAPSLLQTARALIVRDVQLLWRRRGDALQPALFALLVVVLFVPAALPWYYTWPLAVAAAVAQSRVALAVIAAASTWVMVIFKPDGSHGMYSWIHCGIATACALVAWYSLYRAPEAEPLAEPSVSTP